MIQASRTRVSRYTRTNDDADRPYTVWVIRLNHPGSRFVDGVVGLPPHAMAREVGARYRKAKASEAIDLAADLNALDLAAKKERA